VVQWAPTTEKETQPVNERNRNNDILCQRNHLHISLTVTGVIGVSSAIGLG